MDNLAHAEAADQQAAEAPSEMDWHANFPNAHADRGRAMSSVRATSGGTPGAVDRVP